MAETSFPFASSEITTEDQWSRNQRLLQLDGVAATDPSGTDLRVSGSNASTLTVSAGESLINGFYYRNDANLTVAVPTNSGGGSARKDLVVLRCDPANDIVSVKYKTGGTSFPTPATDRSGVFEIPLAQVTVAAGASVVPSTGVVDQRWFLGRQVVVCNPGVFPPPIKGLLAIVGKAVYLGNGVGWDLLATAGQDTGWKPITLASGFATQTAPCGYRVKDGMVYLRGNLKKTSGDLPNGVFTEFATLPSEARPAYTRFGIMPTEWANTQSARVEVRADGSCWFGIPAGSSPSWLGLDTFCYSL